ncbi:MAG: tetratricopeptide repeat protein [Gammaproteobacteria bacterium]|nr:tetratricopeptide repeat protein [Gammaproteobacteria bacterium]MBU1416842.1 tetratricopeptide repeat protein [Gammaproteobacteria bacterium]
MDFEHWRHYARGWLLHFFGRDDAAFDAYAEAFRLRPDDVQAARHLGFIAARQAHLQVAEKWLHDATRLAPDDADSHFNLGFVREKLGNSRMAIESFAAAVRLNPKLDRAWYGMGLAHASLGEHAEAATAFNEAAALQPLHGEALYQLGMARQHAGDSDGVEAIVLRLARFDSPRARKLIDDAERADLLHLLDRLSP